MGCINSKNGGSVVAVSPALDCPASAATENCSGLILPASSKHQSGNSENVRDEEKLDDSNNISRKNSREFRKSKKGSGSFNFKLGFSHRFVEAEQIAAGWPAWLSAAAADAVHGWVPLQADAYEKLEKIGQGTYSSVFRAREVETGRMVALKKVRFDNFQPESIRFMAREIMILRRLEHPNIMKLEGVITSRLSSTIYLVFEYMEHDLAGLSSCPEIRFTEAQVKCYMKQLLCGLEHCHMRGIMHRDIKASNILVNNEGILKMGDFGLATILTSKNKQQLTSRVVTLWYRPPELLMGSTSYEVSVDLWSVGCVFAELLLGKPILKGRTEVEQLHKIFKLCGSPPDDYWKKIRLPHATMFKPQFPYESTLRERCRDVPPSAMNLLENFLSVDPHKRGTASSALMSEYFHSKPFACDSSSLPKYPPNKEIDAKQRDELRRKKAGSKMRDHGASRKPRRSRKTLQEPNFSTKDIRENTQFARKNISIIPNNRKVKEGGIRTSGGQLNQSMDTMSENSQMTSISQGEVFTGPPPVAASGSFAWAKKRKDAAASTLSCNLPSSRSQISEVDSSSFNFSNNAFNLTKDDYQDNSQGTCTDSIANNNGVQMEQQHQLHSPDSFNARAAYHSWLYQNDAGALKNNPGNVQYSGPLTMQSHKFDELLQRNENHIRHVAHRSRFERGPGNPPLPQTRQTLY